MHQVDLELNYGTLEGEITEPNETIREALREKVNSLYVLFVLLCSPMYEGMFCVVTSTGTLQPTPPAGHAKYNLHN